MLDAVLTFPPGSGRWRFLFRSAAQHCRRTRIPLNPTKKLKLTTTSKEGESTESNSSAPLVAAKDGKFVIPVPVPAE